MPLQMDEAPASDAFSAMRRDPKFLYMMATSTRDPIFRAEFAKFFWMQFQEAKKASLEFQGSSIQWGSFGSRAHGNPDFLAVWLLPYIHGAIAGGTGKGSITQAKALLDEHPELDTKAKAYGPAWWAASEKLRKTTGGRWKAISAEYGELGWFKDLTFGMASRYGRG